MRRLLIAAALICFALSGSLTTFAPSDAADPGQDPATMPDIQRKQKDKAREVACGCCQKCMAAKKAVSPGQEKGTPATNGCKDCCSRCGKVNLPPHENFPPEIIKK